jgi:hypothetical protein
MHVDVFYVAAQSFWRQQCNTGRLAAGLLWHDVQDCSREGHMQLMALPSVYNANTPMRHTPHNEHVQHVSCGRTRLPGLGSP